MYAVTRLSLPAKVMEASKSSTQEPRAPVSGHIAGRYNPEASNEFPVGKVSPAAARRPLPPAAWLKSREINALKTR
jgi:hypothetical protein